MSSKLRFAAIRRAGVPLLGRLKSAVTTQLCILAFESGNVCVEILYDTHHIICIESLRNVLAAVLRPGVDLDHDRTLDARAVRRICKLLNAFAVVRYHPRAAP